MFTQVIASLLVCWASCKPYMMYEMDQDHMITYYSRSDRNTSFELLLKPYTISNIPRRLQYLQQILEKRMFHNASSNRVSYMLHQGNKRRGYQDFGFFSARSVFWNIVKDFNVTSLLVDTQPINFELVFHHFWT